MLRESVSFDVLPVRLAYSEKKIGNITLMMHQAETMTCEDKLVTIIAPTGGGKTLAFLLRIVNSKNNGIIVLPTNELVEDQAQSICSLLLKMEKTVFQPTPVDYYDSSTGNGEDYAVIVATGNRLEEFARKRGKSKGRVLAELLSVNTENILLITNLDTIHLLFRGRYSRSKEIFQDLMRFKILVIDEFHLYFGTTLTNVVFLLWALRGVIDQLIITTATPSDILSYLERIFERSKEIQAMESEEGYPAHQKLRLEVLSLPQNSVLSSDTDIQIATSCVKELYERAENESPTIKTLAIVNSIAFCIRLEKNLRKELGDVVSAIHSLIPAEERELRRTSPIVVGTSALEVGIDFDVTSIFVEANNAPALLQRLGRAARKKEAYGIAMIPAEGMIFLRDQLHVKQLSYQNFRGLVERSLPTLSTYVRFLESDEAALLYAGFLYGREKLARGRQSKYDDLKIMRENLIKSVNEPFWQMPFLDLEKLRKLASCFPVRQLESIAEAGLRGYLSSIPAFFSNFKRLSRISFFDLPMLIIKEISTKKEKGLTDRRIKENELILVVEDFANIPFKFRARWDGGFFREVQHISRENLSLNVGDTRYSSIFFKLIEGQPAFATRQRPDWRFASIKHETNNDWIVIGLDAYLQKYIDSCDDQL